MHKIIKTQIFFISSTLSQKIGKMVFYTLIIPQFRRVVKTAMRFLEKILPKKAKNVQGLSPDPDAPEKTVFRPTCNKIEKNFWKYL